MSSGTSRVCRKPTRRSRGATPRVPAPHAPARHSGSCTPNSARPIPGGTVGTHRSSSLRRHDWKDFAGRRVGQAYVGLEFDRPVAIDAVAIRPDNIVYGVSDIFVEYYDADDDVWVTHTVLEGVPLHYGQIGSGGPTYPRDVWYVAPLARCNNGKGHGK